MQPVCRQVAPHIDFIGIKDDRFKTTRLTVAFLLPLDGQTASANAILPFLISRSCADFPDFAALQRHLNSLYGARILSDISRIGNNQALILTAVSIDDRFCLNNEKIVDRCARLLRSMIFEPALTDGRFSDRDTAQEKRCLIELIKSEINEKRLYSRHRCEQILCEGEGYSVNRYGTVDGVNALTPQSAAGAWRNMLRRARVRVVCQSMSGDSVFDTLKTAFGSVKDRDPVAPVTMQPVSPPEIREVTESMDVGQTIMVMGFRAPGPEDLPAMRLMNALLGGTPHSLLFKNVREKHGLCYYCTSTYDRTGRVLLIDCGINGQNSARAREEILAQYDAVCRGEFTDNDILSARFSLENQFKLFEDSQSSLADFYITQSLDGNTTTPSQEADRLSGVTRERIINAARGLRLGAVYMLSGKGG